LTTIAAQSWSVLFHAASVSDFIISNKVHVSRMMDSSTIDEQDAPPYIFDEPSPSRWNDPFWFNGDPNDDYGSPGTLEVLEVTRFARKKREYLAVS
jgi:hypothetical protein